MNNDLMTERSNKINKLIRGRYAKLGDELSPIPDGIVSINNYCDDEITRHKILWVLKDPYETMGGWKFTSDINLKYLECMKLPAMAIIANISFGILNSRQYSNNSLSNKLFDMKRVADSISQIAFINIKKTLGNPYSFGWEIEDSYIRDKEIILMQIKLYLPDAIIICGLEKCGSAQKMLLKDLKIDSENFISLGKNSSIKYFSDTNRIIISAYPLTYVYNNHVASREKYCNDIINIVNLWIDAKSRRN